jgi:hypothetical protein
LGSVTRRRRTCASLDTPFGRLGNKRRVRIAASGNTSNSHIAQAKSSAIAERKRITLKDTNPRPSDGFTAFSFFAKTLCSIPDISVTEKIKCRRRRSPEFVVIGSRHADASRPHFANQQVFRICPRRFFHSDFTML